MPDEAESAYEQRENERGAVATEYVFVATLIALVMAIGAAFLGEQVGAIFEFVGDFL